MTHHLTSLPWRTSRTVEIFRSLADLFWETKPLGKLRGSKSKGLYGCLQKIVVLYPQIIHFNRVFHYFHHPFWGTTIFGNTHIYIYIYRGGNPTVKGFQGFYLTVYISEPKIMGEMGGGYLFCNSIIHFLEYLSAHPLFWEPTFFSFQRHLLKNLHIPKRKSMAGSNENQSLGFP